MTLAWLFSNVTFSYIKSSDVDWQGILSLIWGGTDTSVCSPHKHLSAWMGLNPVGEPPLSACLTWSPFYCTLMGASTGSSPCSDSCFKALRAAWERETTDGWVSKEGRVRDRVGGEWVSPFSCFSNNTYAGKPDASRTLSLALSVVFSSSAITVQSCCVKHFHFIFWLSTIMTCRNLMPFH